MINVSMYHSVTWQRLCNTECLPVHVVMSSNAMVTSEQHSAYPAHALHIPHLLRKTRQRCLNMSPALYSFVGRAGRSGDRIPVGTRLSAPVQTGPGAHPASCAMGTGSFPGVKRPGRGVDHPPSSSKKGKVTPLQTLRGPGG
jgi:hypothetical protein